MALENLLLLCPAIGAIRRPCTMVGSPRAGGFSDDHVITGEGREQLPTSFSMLRRQLSMCLEMLDDRSLEEEALLRSAQIKYDHRVSSSRPKIIP